MLRKEGREHTPWILCWNLLPCLPSSSRGARQHDSSSRSWQQHRLPPSLPLSLPLSCRRRRRRSRSRIPLHTHRPASQLLHIKLRSVPRFVPPSLSRLPSLSRRESTSSKAAGAAGEAAGCVREAAAAGEERGSHAGGRQDVAAEAPSACFAVRGKLQTSGEGGRDSRAGKPASRWLDRRRGSSLPSPPLPLPSPALRRVQQQQQQRWRQRGKEREKEALFGWRIFLSLSRQLSPARWLSQAREMEAKAGEMEMRGRRQREDELMHGSECRLPSERTSQAGYQCAGTEAQAKATAAGVE